MLQSSLKTRMTIAISSLVVFLLAGMALFYLSYFTRELRLSISRQHLALISVLAEEIDQSLGLAREQIGTVASALTPEIIEQPASLQRFLDQRSGSRLFNNGLYFFSAGGRLLAASPHQPEMIGQDFSNRPYIQQARAASGEAISEPFLSSQQHGHPILMFTAPVLTSGGDLAGILAGSIDLLRSSHLSRLGSVRLGDSGFICLLDRQRRLVLHHDTDRILQEGISEGAIPLLDGAMAGLEVSGRRLSAEGIPVLSSYKRLRERDWVLRSSYPIAEAFAPVHRAWAYGLIALALGSVASVTTVGLLMRRLTAPLSLLSSQVRGFGDDPERQQPIDLDRRDEIGQLAQAFNHMRQQVIKRSQALELAYDFHLGLLDDFPTLIWRTDRQGKCDYVNSTWLAFTGRAHAEETGDGWLDSLDADSQDRCRQKFRQVLAQPAPFNIELRLRRNDGSWRWVLGAGRPFNDLAGNFAGFLCTGLDITDRRLLLDQLRRISIAVEQSPAAVIITDTRGRIEYVNPEFVRTSGFSVGEALGQHLGFLLAEQAPAAKFQGIRDQLFRGNTWRGEFLNRRKSGKLFWEEVKISPVRDGSGIISHFVAVAIEITDRKHEQENSTRREKLLEGTNQAVIRFLQSGEIADLASCLVENCRTTIGSTGGMICDLDKSGLLARAGDLPSALEHFFDGEESELSTLPPCCRDLLTRTEQERSILVNAPPPDGAGSVPNGSPYRSVLAVRLKIAQETLGVLALFDKPGGFSEHDRRILENFSQTAALAIQGGRAEKGRQEAADHLRVVQKFEAIGQLASGVAHDFNNLLTVINGYCSLLLRTLEDEPDKRSDAEMILSAGQKAENLTRQLLAFSKQQVLEPVLLDLNHLIVGFEKILRRLVRENINIHWRLADSLAPVLADPGQIEQILINFMVNARDAIADEGTIAIETGNVVLDEAFVRRNRGSVPGPCVYLRVDDNGSGMTEEVRSRAFEPFFTTKPKGEGTGLGLSTVYGIVKQSGGYITLESVLGEGTSFCIYLPAVSGQEAAPDIPPPPALPSGSETILVVEDEETVLQLTAELLRQQGYQVLTAGGAQEALHAFDRAGESIDLLLTDLGMPGSGGVELARQLLTRRPRLRILYMSGYGEFNSGGLPADFFTSRFLQKPFTPESLIGKVQQILANI